MNQTDAIAFAFAPRTSEQALETQSNVFVQVFNTASDCRRALACAAADVQVLITKNSSEVSPLNLAAALHKDNCDRDIYLEQTQSGGLLISKADAAGVRGVISDNQVQELLMLPEDCLVAKAENAGEGRFEVPSNSPSNLTPAPNNSSPSPSSPTPAPSNSSFEPSNSTFAPNNSVSNPSNSTAKPESKSATKPLTLPNLKSESIGQTQQTQQTQTINAVQDLTWLDDLIDLDQLESDEATAQPTNPAAVVLERPEVVDSPVVHKQTDTSVQVREIVDQEQQAKVVAFVSGRGGVGKSTLALLTAVTIWKSGQRVALLDLDLQFGDLSYLVGNESQLSVLRLDGGALLQGQMHLPVINNQLLLIEAPGKPELAEDLIKQIPVLLKLLKQTADLVIINTSCLWNEVLAVLCQNSDQLLFVMDQRSTSIRGCRQAVDLCERLQIPSTHFSYLLNRCSKTAPITDIDASLAMHGAEIISVVDGGAEVDELLSLGCPAELLQEGSAFATSISALADFLLRDTAQSNSKNPGATSRRENNPNNTGKGFRNGYGFGKSGRKGAEL